MVTESYWFMYIYRVIYHNQLPSFYKRFILNHSPVSLCSSRCGVADLICGTLQEFRVRLNRMSTSSVNSARSDLQAGRLADAAPQAPQARSSSVRAALSMHCASSLVHAAFSSTLPATVNSLGKNIKY